MEKCPKCGGYILDSILASNPPQLKKECLECGRSWLKTRKEVDATFYPDKSWKEFSLGYSNRKEVECE